MPETKEPRERLALEQALGATSSISPPESRREEQPIWPRDMNADATRDAAWGADPEALGDA